MSIPKLLEDLAVISKLGDNPGTDNNLTTSAFRAKFDEAALLIQRYINDTLVPAFSTFSDPEAGLTMRGDIDLAGYKLTGLKEPVDNKDAVTLEFVNKTFALANNLTALVSALDEVSRKADNAQDTADNASAAASAAQETAGAALPKSGGTMTGPLVLTEGVHYGDTLPSAGTPGRIFFKKVT